MGTLDTTLRTKLSTHTAREIDSYVDERVNYVYDDIKTSFVNHIYLSTTKDNLSQSNSDLSLFLVPANSDATKRDTQRNYELNSFLIQLGKRGVVSHYACGLVVTSRMDALLQTLFSGNYWLSLDNMLTGLGLQVISEGV